MTKFYLHCKQAGEGCDYMIGCGQKLSALRAQTLEAAVHEAIEVIVEDGGLGDEHWNERVLDEALIFAAPAHTVDLSALRAEAGAAAEAKARDVELARERAEFERLSKKFGGGR